MSSTTLMERIRNKRKEIQARSGQREELLKVPSGKHKFRILPAKPGSETDEFWADFGQHFIKSEEKNERGNRKVKAVYVCVDKTFGKPCAICSTIEDMIPQATDDEQIELLDESKCRRAEILVNCLHLTGDASKVNTPQILQLTPTTFETILGLMDEYGDITDLNEGVDLVIERSGAGLNTKYTVMPAAKSQKVNPTVLDSMVDLREFVQQEHEEGLTRAISAVNSAVGLLDAPMTARTTAKTLPSKTVGASAAASEPAPAASKAKSALPEGIDEAIDAEFDELDMIAEEMKAVETVAEEKKVVNGDAPAAASAGAVDDMDALLAELEAL